MPRRDRRLHDAPAFLGDIAAVTWVGQIMPLFFVVGGFTAITAWRNLTWRARHGRGLRA